MAKLVKVHDSTYERLKALMSPSDSFDSIINKLLDRLAELESKVAEMERTIEYLKDLNKKTSNIPEDIEEKVKEVHSVWLDRAGWYVVKLAFGVQALKDAIDYGLSPVVIDEKLARLAKVCKQIKERYGVETEILVDIAKQYAVEKDKESKIVLNDATKEIVKNIISKILSLNVIR